MDQHAGVLKIKIPPRETGGAHVTVTTPLDPSPDQIAFYELIEDINIWGAKVLIPKILELNPSDRMFIQLELAL